MLIKYNSESKAMDISLSFNLSFATDVFNAELVQSLQAQLSPCLLIPH